MKLPRLLLVVGLAAGTLFGPAAVSADAVVIVDATNAVASSGPTTQTGRIDPNPVASACNPTGFDFSPTITDGSTQFHYVSHTFRSRLTAPICVTADLTTSCTAANSIFSVAYLGTFNPANPLENYLADIGQTPPMGMTYSFEPPGGSPFAIVVHEANANSGCVSYTLKVSTDGPWVDLAAPAIVGNAAAIGNTITGNDAAWNPGPPTPTVQRGWRRCDAAGTSCTDISGATGISYTVTNEDLGHTLRFRNVATDTDGTSTSDSSTVEPFIPFDARTAESLGPGDRVHSGIFVRDSVDSRCSAPKSAPTVLQAVSNFLYDSFSVQSLLNEPVCLVVRTLPGTGCNSGVTPSIYAPSFVPAAGITQNYAGNSGTAFDTVAHASTTLPAAEGREVIVSSGGSAAACAQYGATLGTDAPFASARPTTDGTPVEGGTLTAGDGAWSGAPSFSHAWLRCDGDGAGCAAIDAATNVSYTPTAADIGARLRARVTATQGSRSVSSDSEPTGVVLAAAGGGNEPPPGGGNGTPLDKTGPRAKLALARTSLQKVVRTGRIPVRVVCDEACRLTIRANVTRKLAKRLGGVKIASGKGKGKAGRRVTLKLKLTRKARRALRRRKSVAFVLRATATDGAGNRAKAKKRARVRRKR